MLRGDFELRSIAAEPGGPIGDFRLFFTGIEAEDKEWSGRELVALFILYTVFWMAVLA